MKATSVQNIKNVRNISFSIENHPMEIESKLTIVASTNDDVFAFEFEGSDLLEICKAAGLFTGWEKDQKIRELEKDNKNLTEAYNSMYESVGRSLREQQRLKKEYEEKIRELEKELSDWKKEASDCLRLRDEAQKEAYKLKKENEKYEEKIKKLEHDDMLDKNAADYWSKEHDILLERFAKLQVENEKLKEENEQYKEEDKMEATSVWKIDGIDKIWITQDGDEISLLLKNRDDLTKIILIGEAIKNHNDNFITTLKADLEENEKEFSNQEKKIRELEKKISELEELKTPTIENFADEEPSSRRDILRCAEKCVCGKREQDYGTPESNFQLIADLWNDYLKKERSSIVVDAKDVSMLMALMKIARIRNGGGSGDSFVDLAGYAACGGEIWASNKATNGDSN